VGSTLLRAGRADGMLMLSLISRPLLERVVQLRLGQIARSWLAAGSPPLIGIGPAEENN